jgi:hypothetical protein
LLSMRTWTLGVYAQGKVRESLIVPNFFDGFPTIENFFLGRGRARGH